MEEIKVRTRVVLRITSGQLHRDREDVAAELASLQIRKVLELLAFASLLANKAVYTRVYSNFAKHWNAKRLLANLRTLNPRFYPTPIVHGADRGGGPRHFDIVQEPYLTQDDLVFLYDRTSQVLHARNPFSKEPLVIEFRHSLSDWVGRIQALLRMHYVQFVDSAVLWMVVMESPEDG